MVGAWFVLAGDEGESGRDQSPKARVSPAGTSEQRQVGEEGSKASPPEPELPEMSCPTELTNCEAATGRVIYVEAVDPDGDGDAHFVTLSNQSITSTGITVFDVKPELRPDPLPGRGDLVGGYGPVYKGSYGQSQIEVIGFQVAR